MAADTPRDDLYALPQGQVVDFAFNAAVADVFPDMIRRSIPGYETVISLLGVLAKHYAQPHTAIYDMGCSLGAATLAMAVQVRDASIRYVCVDNSPAMVTRCTQIMQRHLPAGAVQVECADIRTLPITNASVVVLNFTLQFLPPTDRLAMLQRIHAGLLPGGALILSEKLHYVDPQEQDLLTALHLAFKRANGYSELEISQKRAALEQVLIPDTYAQHVERLRAAGFTTVIQWFQAINFASFLAVKA